MRTADDIAGMYLGGDAARSDLANHILEYGEAMALFAVKAERERCARLVESLPPGDGFGGLNRNDIASRIRNPIN